VQVPSQFLTMLPYVATIVVLVLISRNPAWIRVNMPARWANPGAFLPVHNWLVFLISHPCQPWRDLT
jgi:predicted permease